MSDTRKLYPPLSLKKARKDHPRQQAAALCYRYVGGKLRVLLVTSRDTGRWVLPKGWIIEGLGAAGSAAEEAWEEAGVRGRMHSKRLGRYAYTKRLSKGDGVPCIVNVYAIKVKSMSFEFPEQGQRKRKWTSRKKAAKKIYEPELAEILLHFDPAKLPR